MTLAWIAAVLQPQDLIAAHDRDEPGGERVSIENLAGAVSGSPRFRARGYLDPDMDVETDDLVALGMGCMVAETLVASVQGLGRRIKAGECSSPEQAAALTLLACSAAAEIEDYAFCFDLLEHQLSSHESDYLDTPDGKLVRSALLMQLSLRLLDTDADNFGPLEEARRLLTAIRGATFAGFPLRADVAWTSSRTVGQIRLALSNSCLSLLTVTQWESQSLGRSVLRTRKQAPRSDADFFYQRQRADVYARSASELFKDGYRSRTRTIGGSGVPDLYFSTLAMELISSRTVYEARKELALLRLVRERTDVAALSDAIRSLRQAGAKTELDLALQQLVSVGPVEPIVRDCQQILRRRLAPNLLRSVEHRVLRSAADFLTPEEAQTGLNAILAQLGEGIPPNNPLAWQLDMLRVESAWAAAVELAHACGQDEFMSNQLMRLLRNAHWSESDLDTSLSRVLNAFRWDLVGAASRNEWVKFTEAFEGRLESVQEVLSIHLPEAKALVFSPVENAEQTGMDKVVASLNVALGGGEFPVRLVESSVQLVLSRLETIRRDAAAGAHGMGGVNPGDVAAGLAIVTGENSIWTGLIDFLTDVNVQRADKSPAFERLARWPGPMRSWHAAAFADRSESLLRSPGYDPFELTVEPYPAALRFLSRHGIVDMPAALRQLFKLAEADAPGIRQEAAKTLGLLAFVSPEDDLLPLAMTLASDTDSQVRAHAGRAIAGLVSLETPLARLASVRLVELLRDGGVLNPRLAIMGLKEAGQALSGELAVEVANLRDHHPSLTVRTEAQALLSDDSVG